MRLMSRSASRNFNVWLNLYFVYTTGKIPDNAGQVLKDLLVDNNVDIAKFVSYKHKKSKPVNTQFQENWEMHSFPIVRRKKLR